MGKSYEIPIRISLLTEVTVEADSLKEAQQKAKSFELLDQLLFLNDGFLSGPLRESTGQWREFDQTTEVSDGG
jgi:hypothetical protein